MASQGGAVSFLGLGLILAACAGLSGTQGDPAAPILVKGRVVGSNDTPVGGARIQLEVVNYAGSQNGEAPPDVYRQSFTAALDGTFEIHLRPPVDLAAFALANGGSANFVGVVFGANGAFLAAFNFQRQIVGGTWASGPETLVVGPDGIQQPAAN